MSNSLTDSNRVHLMYEASREGGSALPAVDAYVSCVYHFTVGRNAWHGSWSSTYPSTHSFSLEMDDLVTRVERSRVQGSTFWIYELPALAISDKEGRTLLTVDLHPQGRAPFEGTKGIGRPRKTVASLAHWAVQYCPRTVAWWLDEPPELAQAPFRKFRSIAQGADAYLGWSESKEPINSRPAFSLASRLRRMLRSAG